MGSTATFGAPFYGERVLGQLARSRAREREGKRTERERNASDEMFFFGTIRIMKEHLNRRVQRIKTGRKVQRKGPDKPRYRMSGDVKW